MADWVACLFLAIVIAGIVVIVGMFAREVPSFVIFVRSRWGVRVPVYDKRKPDPNQWLLDIAQDDANRPVKYLLILKQTVSNKDLDPNTMSPWVEVSQWLYNGGVHSIVVGPIKGRGSYEGQDLPEPVEGPDGRSRYPRGHTAEFKIKQRLPPDVAAKVYEEIRKTGKLRSLGLSNVRLQVESESVDGQTVSMALGRDDTYWADD